jgi:plastocyanin
MHAKKGTGDCDDCVAGKYQDTVGNSECEKCGVGTYSTTLAATMASTCLNCNVADNNLFGATQTTSSAGSDNPNDCIYVATMYGYASTKYRPTLTFVSTSLNKVYNVAIEGSFAYDTTTTTNPSIMVGLDTTILFKRGAFADHPIQLRREEDINSGGSGLWDSALLSEGEKASYTFTTAGTYEYYCTSHSDMKGTITVTHAVAQCTERCVEWHGHLNDNFDRDDVILSTLNETVGSTYATLCKILKSTGEMIKESGCP